MKKKFSMLLIILAFLLTISFLFAFSSVKKTRAEDKIESKSCYLIDYKTKNVIYKKDEEKQLPIASMCKIMTLNLIFDEIEAKRLDLDENIFVSENASMMGGSQIFLEGNKEYKVSELIKGIVVASANDACVAFAEKIASSEEQFVSKMNEKAKSLGMNNTVFTNCTGLPKVGQHSTAKDVAIMFSELLTHKDYFNFSRIWMDEIHHDRGRITEISNTNKLIRFYQGCDGGKTGYTSEAGHCLTATAVKNNMRVISVIISAPDSKTRFRETTQLFNYAFNNYENKIIVNKDEKITESKILNAKKENYDFYAKEDYVILSKKNEKQAFSIETELNENLKAPIMIGETVGKLKIYQDGILKKEIDLTVNENVERNGYVDNIKNISEKWSIFN